MNFDLPRFGEAKDVRAELILATKKAIAGIQITRNRVLVGSYVAPSITAGGIILTHGRMVEDRFQGKCGLVLKMGPQAFRFPEDPERKHAPKVGTWVLYRAADTYEVAIGEGAPCRFIYDELIQAFDIDPKDFY